MKERKSLFPEYIWMFFVGLLLAIIICMRLLPGQAAMYEETAYNNVIFVRITGWTLSFGNEYCDPATAVLNENNSNWSDNDLFKSDLDYNVFMLTNKFGAENLSICLLDDDAVAYAFRYIAALCYKYNINCLYYGNDQDTGTIEGMNFSINPAPWRDNVYTYFSPYYEFYTFSLSSYTLGYYVQHDQYVTPTPSLSPSPTPEASEPCFTYCVKCDTSYYLVDIYGEVGHDLQANTDTIFNQVASDYNSTDRTLLWPCFVIKNGRYDGYGSSNIFYGPYIIFYGQFNSFVKAVSYNMGSAYISDFDYVRSTFTALDVPESSSASVGYLGYQLQTLTEGGYCLGLWTRGAMQYSSYPSVVEYCDFEYVTTSFYYDRDDILLYPFRNYINDMYYPKNINNYYLSLIARLGLSTDTPVEGDATPTPSPTATPTQAPYVEVILPSPTPGPTAPVSFNDSDLPGGASGEGGSISSNDGASSSTADGVYNYWSYVISQNQALAFIASFFQILPFDLVYALGSLIFILILIAMARLFIHFIE